MIVSILCEVPGGAMMSHCLTANVMHSLLSHKRLVRTTH